MTTKHKITNFLVYVSSVVFLMASLLSIVARIVSDTTLAEDPLARYSALTAIISLLSLFVALEEADQSNKYVKSVVKLRHSLKIPFIVAIIFGIITFIVMIVMTIMFLNSFSST